MQRGGQVSIEFLIVTGFSLLLLIPLIILFASQSTAVRSDLVEAQAHSAAQALIDSAQRVYYAGPPTTETVSVYLPASTSSVTIRNGSVAIGVTTPKQYDYVIASSVPLVQTTLPGGQGRTSIRVQATSLGVSFTEQ